MFHFHAACYRQYWLDWDWSWGEGSLSAFLRKLRWKFSISMVLWWKYMVLWCCIVLWWKVWWKAQIPVGSFSRGGPFFNTWLLLLQSQFHCQFWENWSRCTKFPWGSNRGPTSVKQSSKNKCRQVDHQLLNLWSKLYKFFIIRGLFLSSSCFMKIQIRADADFFGFLRPLFILLFSPSFLKWILSISFKNSVSSGFPSFFFSTL